MSEPIKTPEDNEPVLENSEPEQFDNEQALENNEEEQLSNEDSLDDHQPEPSPDEEPLESHEGEQLYDEDPLDNDQDDEFHFDDEDDEQEEPYQDPILRDRIQNQLQEDRLRYKKTSDDTLPIYQVPPEVLNKYKFIFVEPTGYEAVYSLGQDSEARVFVVNGEDFEWNLVCGVCLGTNLIRDQHAYEKPVVMIYRRDSYNTRSLVDFVQHRSVRESSRQGTVYVIENAFTRGIQREDLAPAYLSRINDELESLQAYLILTSKPTDPVVGVESLIATFHENTLSELFNKHLEYYEQYKADKLIYDSVIELARQQRRELFKRLKTYTQIKAFCDAITTLPSDCTAKKLLEKADEVLHVNQKEVSLYFKEKLSPNARLYAMLAVLFDDMEKQFVDNFYMVAVQTLRHQGIADLRDSREFGMFDLLEEIQAELGTDGRISFKTGYFKDHILRQQIRNHHHLLWSLMEIIYELIDKLKAERYANFRQSLGKAIGRLGIYEQEQLFILLQKLAEHEDGNIASVPAYALDEICRHHPEQFDEVAKRLEQWAQSTNPDLMWATGVVVGRIYATVASHVQQPGGPAAVMLDRLKHILFELASAFDGASSQVREEAQKWIDALMEQQKIDSLQLSTIMAREIAVDAAVEGWFGLILGAIARAMGWIADTHASDAVDMILQWLHADSESAQYQLELGEKITSHLFDVSIYGVANFGDDQISHEVILVETRHAPLLRLIGPILRLAALTRRRNKETLQKLVDTLEILLRNNADWGQRIHAELLKVVNRATFNERWLLRNVLSDYFLTSEQAATQRIGQALIARSYVMDGVPLDMPARRYGVLALDGSRLGRLAARAAKMGRRLYERLDGRVDMYAFLMGEAKIRARPGQAPTTAQLRSTDNYPRLLSGALERLPNLEQEQIHFVLALTWDKILDAEDLDESSLQDKLIVASPDEAVKWRDEMAFIHLNIQSIENKLNEHLGQQIAALSASDWWATLEPYLRSDPTDIDQICAQLDRWAVNLDDVEESKHPGDVTRTLACTILWLVKVDFARSLSLIEQWLEGSVEEPQGAMGLACAKLLFNVYREQKPLSSPDTLGPILDLVPPMARTRDWGAIEVVLRTMRCWLAERKWARYLLSTRANLFPILVDHTPPQKHRRLKQILNQWLKDEDAPEAVYQAAERMLIRLVLGEGRKLPELPKDQKYGLILLDASRRRTKTLAEIAIKVIKELLNRETSKDYFVPLTCRLGQRMPVAMKKQIPSLEELFPPGFPVLPRLAAPLLEQIEPEQVGFILLLTNYSTIDQEYLLESWKNMPIFLYRTASNKSDWPPSITLIPQQRNLQSAARVIVNSLINTMKG